MAGKLARQATGGNYKLNGIRDFRGRDLSYWSLRADFTGADQAQSTASDIMPSGDVEAQLLDTSIYASDISDPVQFAVEKAHEFS